MKKIVLLIFTSILLFSCKNDPKQKLLGDWKEYWGIGQQTDVDYHNINKIQLLTDGNLVITCVTENHYLFDKIVFDGTELSFRKENTSDPNEKFYVYYKLKLNKDGKWMEGTIINSKGQTDNLKWEKVK